MVKVPVDDRVWSAVLDPVLDGTAEPVRLRVARALKDAEGVGPPVEVPVTDRV
jgi:hypothetical protein